jgi:hypothetical protein
MLKVFMKRFFYFTPFSRDTFFAFALFLVISITILAAIDLYFGLGLKYRITDIKIGLTTIPLILLVYLFTRFIQYLTDAIGGLFRK